MSGSCLSWPMHFLLFLFFIFSICPFFCFLLHEDNAEDLEAFLQGLVKSWNYKNSPVKDDGASVSTRLNRLPHRYHFLLGYFLASSLSVSLACMHASVHVHLFFSIILSVPVMLDEDLELFKRIKGHLKVMVNNEVFCLKTATLFVARL
jgi:hypothetical protein